MILKTSPTTEVEIHDMSGSARPIHQFAGRQTITNVEIICPDRDNSKDEVWNRLKYGPQPDLGEAMLTHNKIEVIDFPKDGITLYGVHPVSMTRTAIWDGQVFECTVDSYAITTEDV